MVVIVYRAYAVRPAAAVIYVVLLVLTATIIMAAIRDASKKMDIDNRDE